jgi:hypothetical protein
MTGERQIRQFLLSTKDEFPKDNLPYVLNWFNRKRNEPFYFRYRKPVDFPVGSIAVFLYEGRYVGYAVTNGEVLTLSRNSRYTGTVSFDPKRMTIFSRYPLRLEGQKFYRNLVRLTWSQFRSILRVAGEDEP